MEEFEISDRLCDQDVTETELAHARQAIQLGLARAGIVSVYEIRVDGVATDMVFLPKNSRRTEILSEYVAQQQASGVKTLNELSLDRVDELHARALAAITAEPPSDGHVY